MPRVLIVDDEDSVLRILSTLFSTRGYETATASDGTDAMNVLEKEKFDVMLTDVRMRPMDGLALLKFVHDHDPEMPVILLTAYASVESAIEALKHGAFDYITKPFDIGELVKTVDRALAFRKGASHGEEQREREDVRFYLDEIVAESEAMQDICDKVRKIAPTDTLVTLVGEAGCSKGMLAKALHDNSKRKGKPFHRINCAVIPAPLMEAELCGAEKGAIPGIEGEKQGIFEQVRGGTLLMEEIGYLPMDLQETLFNILQEKKVCRIGSETPLPVTTRILASSHHDVEDNVKRGGFREDLFLRLNVVTLRIKPLRERPEDIVPLFAHFLGRALKEGEPVPEMTGEVQAVLKSYDWSGNAEELENAAEFAANNLKNNSITAESLPPKIACTPVKAGLRESEPMKARALRAFLVKRGAEKDLKEAEAEAEKDQDNTAS
jgi:two-component system response regulator AtoC